jgi:hypothetical protein
MGYAICSALSPQPFFLNTKPLTFAFLAFPVLASAPTPPLHVLAARARAPSALPRPAMCVHVCACVSVCVCMCA